MLTYAPPLSAAALLAGRRRRRKCYATTLEEEQVLSMRPRILASALTCEGALTLLALLVKNFKKKMQMLTPDGDELSVLCFSSTQVQILTPDGGG